jgi:hypothetical protein
VFDHRPDWRRLLLVTALAGLGFATALPALASAPRKNARYVGETSQLRTLQVRVSRTGKRIVSPSIVTVDLTCPRNRAAFGTIRPEGRIRRGRFSFVVTDRVGPYRYVATMTGRFRDRGRSLAGELTLRRVSSTGTICRSGDVTYTATAKRG